MAEGEPHDLLERLAADTAFAAVGAEELRAELQPGRYVGRAPQQVTEFVEGPLAELLASLETYAVPDDAEVSV
jgi:adenylosuccinate lyase